MLPVLLDAVCVHRQRIDPGTLERRCPTCSGDFNLIQPNFGFFSGGWGGRSQEEDDFAPSDNGNKIQGSRKRRGSWCVHCFFEQ